MIIDIHTHTFPDLIAERAIGSLSYTSHTIPFTDGTDSGLCASMAEAGVDRSVVLSVATSPGQVTTINDSAMRRAREREEKGLIAFAAMHPDFPDWHSELARVKAGGLIGVKLHPVYQGADLDDIRYLRIYDRCAELGLIVILHAGYDIGFPGVDRCSPDMALRALKEMQLFGSFPRSFRFILAHMGGWGQWDDVLRLAPELIEAGPVLLDTAFSLGRFHPLDDGYWREEETALMDEEAFLRIIRAYGYRRILFGSDSPWSSQSEELRFLHSLPLKGSEKDAILGGNAAEILGL